VFRRDSIRLSAGWAISDDGHGDVLCWFVAFTVFRRRGDRDNDWMSQPAFTSRTPLDAPGCDWMQMAKKGEKRMSRHGLIPQAVLTGAKF
jgi:hypothetical protein